MTLTDEQKINDEWARKVALRATDLAEARAIGASLLPYESAFLRAWDDLLAAWADMTAPAPRRELTTRDRDYPLYTTEHG